MRTNPTNMVSSHAAIVGAPSAAYPTSWQHQPCLSADQAIRVRMTGNGFATAPRPKESSSP
jgi:hypothetical protein